MGPYWIKQWISDLALLNEQFRDDDGRVDFEALGREEFAFRTALITRKFGKSERAKEIFEKAKILYETNSKRGSKGGRPPKNPDISATATLQGTDEQKRTGGQSPLSQSPSSRPPVRTSRRIRPPRSFEEVAEFADAQGLDYDDARLWWQRNFVERPGCDKDGVVFENWKGALINACKAEEAKRNG